MSERADLLIARESHPSSRDIEAFRAIFEDSFPASERGDFDKLLQDIAQGVRWLFTAHSGDTLLGVAVLLPSMAPRVHFGEYLAVRHDSRNQGLGSHFIRGIYPHLRSSASGILFEVESPEEGIRAEQELRRRRIDLYLRNGAAMVACAPHYRAPNLAGPGTLAMKLMWLPLDSTPAPTGTLLADCLLALYTKSYNLSANDPLVQEGLQDLAC